MTISRRKKKLKRILDELIPQRGFSTNRGDFVNTKFKLTRKQKKHSGRYTPLIPQKGKISEMIANAEEPKEEYNEWINHRDGFRYNTDRKHFFKKWRACCFSEEEIYRINKKIKKQIALRKAKKLKLIKKTG